MKRFFTILFVCSTLVAAAQNKSTVETKALMSNFWQAKSVDRMSQRLLEKYPLRYDKHGVTIGVLAKVNERFDSEGLKRWNIQVTSRVANIVAMRVPIERLGELERYAGIEIFSVAHRAAPEMNDTRLDTRTDSVQAGEGVPMPFDGEGVLIGITDWGFDYLHPNLTLRAKKKIERAWDHYKLSGPAPEGFDYGTEHKGFEAVEAAKGDTSGLYGYGTHGTHVAGICAGNGLNGNAVGQAPGAHLLLGSWLLDEASWLDQVAWMYGVAKEENKRLVINSSWGMYTFSTIDGTSLLSQGLNAYSDSGIVFVTSAGNNGDAGFHHRRRFANNDTLTSVATWYRNGIGQALLYWGEPEGQFKASFKLVANDNVEDVTLAPYFGTAEDIAYREGFVVTNSGDTVHYDVMTESSNPLNDKPHILLNVELNRSYRLVMVCTADSGVQVDVFNINNMKNHAGNVGCAFVVGGIEGCMQGNSDFSVSEPACAEKCITVAAHMADHYQYGSDSIYIAGGLTDFSSYGPTLDGRNKPEISAPGFAVVSSLSSYSDIEGYTAAYSTFSMGRHYIWSGMSGTSMSSPAVTGIVALMLQANPHLTVDQVREILFTTARNDQMTGALHEMDSVSPHWGYGKVYAVGAVNAAYDKLSVEEAIKNPAKLCIYPNPASDRVSVLTGSNQPCYAELYDIDGRRLTAMTIQSERMIDISTLAQGVYFLKVYDRTGVRTGKIVKR